MTRNSSETDSEMAQNNSDSLGIHFNPIPSPGSNLKIQSFHFTKITLKVKLFLLLRLVLTLSCLTLFRGITNKGSVGYGG